MLCPGRNLPSDTLLLGPQFMLGKLGALEHKDVVTICVLNQLDDLQQERFTLLDTLTCVRLLRDGDSARLL